MSNYPISLAIEADLYDVFADAKNSSGVTITHMVSHILDKVYARPEFHPGDAHEVNGLWRRPMGKRVAINRRIYEDTVKIREKTGVPVQRIINIALRIGIKEKMCGLSFNDKD